MASTYYVDGAVGNDANLGTSPGSGNAWATIGKAASTAAAGDMVWIKASATYTLTIAATVANSGGTAPIVFEGYTSTTGDGGRPTITSSTSGINLIVANFGNTFRHLTFTHTGATRGSAVFCGTTRNGIVMYDCLADGCFTLFNGSNVGAESPGYVLIDGCEAKNCTGTGVRACGLVLLNSYIHDNAGATVDGILTGNFAPLLIHVANSVICRNGRHGLNLNGSSTAASVLSLVGNVWDGNGTDGIHMVSTAVILDLQNNILQSNGGYGINTSGSSPSVAINQNNAYRNNTSGARNSISAGTNDVTLTGDPFTNAAAGDYSLNSTSGAGAACRSVGFPGVSLFGTGYADVGALRHQDAGGGGAILSRVQTGM